MDKNIRKLKYMNRNYILSKHGKEYDSNSYSNNLEYELLYQKIM
jgi:hypothetical protein